MSNRQGKSAQTLAQYLEEHITTNLMNLQNPAKGGGTDAVVGVVIDTILNPLGNPYGLLRDAASRMHFVTERLKQELSDGMLPPWGIPRAASFAFEAVFEGCVAFWIAKGQPKSTRSLDPAVEKFVRAQVALFTAMIGSTSK